MLNFIDEAIAETTKLNPADTTFFDPFTGTTSVAQHFKRLGYTVYTSDFLNLAHVLGKAYIEINSEPKFTKFITKYKVHPIDWLNSIEGRKGFITDNYSPFVPSGRRYFSVENAKRIDAIRVAIDKLRRDQVITNLERYYLIASLLEAINLVSNVSGTYGSFMKSWDKRAYKPLHLSKLNIIHSDKKNKALLGNINDVISEIEADVLYLDPPYNPRQYASNYFLPELIAEGWSSKIPEIYGYTGMRPYDSQKSEFCMKNKAYGALKDVVDNAKAKFIFLSYNNEGILTKDQILSILSGRGTVTVYEFKHKRYRSIGQDGTKVKTIEYLFATEVAK